MITPEVSRLAALARDAAADVPDIPAELASAIRHAASGSADPWMIAGVLIAGLAHVVSTIPAERRRDCGVAAVLLVAKQVRAVGGG